MWDLFKNSRRQILDSFLQTTMLCVLFFVKTLFAEHEAKNGILKQSTRNPSRAMQRRLNLLKKHYLATNSFLQTTTLCVLFFVKTSFAEHEAKNGILKRSTRNPSRAMQRRLNLLKKHYLATKSKAAFSRK